MEMMVPDRKTEDRRKNTRIQRIIMFERICEAETRNETGPTNHNEHNAETTWSMMAEFK
jgi:hypothetical protein